MLQSWYPLAFKLDALVSTEFSWDFVDEETWPDGRTFALFFRRNLCPFPLIVATDLGVPGRVCLTINWIIFTLKDTQQILFHVYLSLFINTLISYLENNIRRSLWRVCSSSVLDVFMFWSYFSTPYCIMIGKMIG